MRRPAALLSIALLCGPLAATPALSQRAQDAGDLARLQAEYRDEQVRARRLRADAAEAAREMVRLDTKLAGLRRDVTLDDQLLDAQRTRLKELGAREAVLVSALARERGRLGRLLSALQMMSRRPPPPLLVPASQAVDTVRASILIKAITPELERRARDLSGRQAEIGRIRRLAALSSEQLFTTESAQSDRRSEIEDLSGRKAALAAVLRAEAEQAERAARTLEARIRALGARPPVVEAQASAPTTTRLPAGRSRLAAPTSGAPVQRFERSSPGWRWRADGATARAPAEARVDYAGPLKGWGQVVILDLGPGWRAVVAGLDTVDVQVGQTVGEGASLGRAPRADDAEIYFELRRDDRPVDPAPWISQ